MAVSLFLKVAAILPQLFPATYNLLFSLLMLRPQLKEFQDLARTATLVPVVKTVMADLLTPVSAFLGISAGEQEAFLLESVEGGERIGRYTFLGVRPYMILES